MPQNIKTFVRRDVRPGIYSTSLDRKKIQIKDRGFYRTGDPLLIKKLENDPELIYYDDKEKISADDRKKARGEKAKVEKKRAEELEKANARDHAKDKK